MSLFNRALDPGPVMLDVICAAVVRALKEDQRMLRSVVLTNTAVVRVRQRDDRRTLTVNVEVDVDPHGLY